jgi:hypothetical protein
MKRLSKTKNNPQRMPLDVMAEKALQEAVAEAIAEHKLRGHPIVVWRDGKVVTIPPEEIVVTTPQINKQSKEPFLRVKEKQIPYGKIRKKVE